jgi:NDP-sugar pyrophosphorylase family protein
VSLLPFCILAGGLATRLGERAKRTPKSLMEVAGRPFAAHQLELLREHGAHRIVMCVGHLGEQVEQAIGDGSQLGLQITYSYDGPTPAGTAGAVRQAIDQLGPRFFVMYGDTFLRIDYAAVQDTFVASGKPALMTVLRNDGRWDASNALFEDGVVVAYDKRNPTDAMRWIDYGLGVLTPAAMAAAAPAASDLADVYHELACTGRLAGFEATERFYEIGTPEALAETDAWLRERHAGA